MALFFLFDRIPKWARLVIYLSPRLEAAFKVKLKQSL